MKATEYRGEVFTKNGEIYTKFTIGSKVVNSRIEKLIIALNGELVKETKMAKHYIVKGDRLNLCLIC